MSGFSTYRGFTLPHQLVRLQQEWTSLKAPQKYGTSQAGLYSLSTGDRYVYEPNGGTYSLVCKFERVPIFVETRLNIVRGTGAYTVYVDDAVLAPTSDPLVYRIDSYFGYWYSGGGSSLDPPYGALNFTIISNVKIVSLDLTLTAS